MAAPTAAPTEETTTMNKTVQLMGALLFVGAFMVACGDDDDTGGGGTGATTGGNGGTTTGGAGGGTGGVPPVPELGAQVDRMGRPAINTALEGAFLLFDANDMIAPGESTARSNLQGQYNQDDQANEWAASYGPTFALNLGVLDALDTGLDLGAGPQDNETACENQLLACANIGDTTGACYATLAGVLATDLLWLRTDGDACGPGSPDDEAGGEGYLAVEAAALGIANTDCGGRRPIDDTIERTYSVTAAGILGGFDDGITPPAGRHPETFPYLADPL
jgi:hypothetical protein